MNKNIIINNLTKIYTDKGKKKIAVNDISFSVDEGEIYCLLGTNGAGKTTTMRCISGLLKPTMGNIYIKNNDVTKNILEVRKNIAFLTGDLKLDDYLTTDYLYKFYSSMYGLDKKKSELYKDELFERLLIREYKDEQIKDLSTGMKQKASFAISMVNDPEVLILDEPTNGLDIIASREIIDFLLEQRIKGKTILLSTHIFEIVTKLADKIGIIIDGNMMYDDYISEKDKVDKIFFDIYDRCKNDSI